MKKIILMSLFITASLILANIGSTTPQNKEEITPVFEQPLLLTSAGQSADVQLGSVLAKKAGLAFTLSKLATGKDLGNYKTLVLVIGASMKGLGAAGLDTNKEKERIKQLLAEAQAKNIPILCLHLGGEARRGELTDELIESSLPLAKMAIVVKAGNKDGIFTKTCKERNIPLIEVEKTLDAVEPLQKAFKKIS